MRWRALCARSPSSLCARSNLTLLHLQLPPSTPTSSSLLHDVLSQALNRFAYLFTTADPGSLASIDEAVRPRARTFTVSTRPEPSHFSSDTLVALAGTAGATAVVDRLSPSSPPSQVAELARLLVRGKYHALGRLPGSIARIFVHEESAGPLLEALLRELESAFGRDAALSSDYGRLRGLEYEAPSLSKEKEAGGRVLCGGAQAAGEDEGFYRPTIVSDPSPCVALPSLATSPAALHLPDSVHTLLLTADYSRWRRRARSCRCRRSAATRTFSSSSASCACSLALIPPSFSSRRRSLTRPLPCSDSTALYVFAAERAVVEYLATESTASVMYENDIPLDALCASFSSYRTSSSAR